VESRNYGSNSISTKKKKKTLIYKNNVLMTIFDCCGA
jgi:hypothetical protein